MIYFLGLRYPLSKSWHLWKCYTCTRWCSLASKKSPCKRCLVTGCCHDGQMADIST